MVDNSLDEELATPMPVYPVQFITVPCVPNFSTGKFDPIYTLETFPWDATTNLAPPPKLNLRQERWTTEEDFRLQGLVEELGQRQWSYIASVLNNEFHLGAENRKSRNCRERWANHVNPFLNKGEWGLDDDIILFRQFKILGKKWRKIAEHIAVSYTHLTLPTKRIV